MSTRRLAALIGSPVSHSLSPVIHQAGFDGAGVDWSYAAFDVAPGDGAAAVVAMRVLGLAGMSVTMPHKHEVIAALDRLDPAAAALQSVNTISWSGDALVGSSTDGAGFVASLADADVALDGASVAVIGAGGAARSVVDALGRAGVSRIVVVNRTRDRAERAAALAGVATVGGREEITGVDIVVNATNVGMGVPPASASADDLPCPVELLHPGQVVADLVYHPLATAWLVAASAIGCRTVDGLGMLIHQAALQQETWIGLAPDVAVMRRAAEVALGDR